MLFYKLISLVMVFSLLFGCQNYSSESEVGERRFDEVRNVVFIGDSITYSGQYIVYLEAYLKALNPSANYEFINVGLPSETVSGLSEPNHAEGKFPRPNGTKRLPSIIETLEPKFIVSCYGINDGIYMPFDRSRFNAYKQGQEFVHQTIKAHGIELIHLTPPDYDKKIDVEYAAVIDTYSEWLVNQRHVGWQVIDIQSAMEEELSQKRSVDPTFFYAHDGIHPNEVGHWRIAQSILQQLGYQPKATLIASLRSVNPRLDVNKWIKAFSEKHKLSKDSYLDFVGHDRPFMENGLDVHEMKQKVKQLNDEIDLLWQQSII